MFGFFLIIVRAFTGLAEGVFIKQYNKKHSNGGFMFTAAVSLFSMLFFVVKGWISGFNFSLSILPYGIIAGCLYLTASLLTYLAIQCGSFAISMLILSYSLVFSIVYGIGWLSEEPTAFTYVGFVLVAISLFLVRKKRDDKDRRFSFKWLVFITLSVFGSGMYGVLSRVQQIKFEDVYSNEFMIIALGFSAFALALIGIVKDKKECFNILKRGLPYASLAGIANGATNMLGLVIFTLLPLSVSAPTGAGVKCALSFLLSYFFFKEKFLPRQIVGVIFGALAVVFLNI